MTDKTHQLIGLTAATTVVLITRPELPITWPIVGTIAFGSFIGSLAPDIDQPTAHLWDELPLGHFLGKLTSRALGGHRNLSHSILGVILFSLLVYWLVHFLPLHWVVDRAILFISAVTGFIAHLIADSVTVLGIPLFWPFGNNMGFPPHPLQGIRIVTGHWFENLIIFPLTFAALGLIVWLHFTRFCPILPLFCS